jgi:hypothetical protein
MTTDKAQRTPYKIPFIIVAVLLLALVVKEGIPYLVKPKLYVVQCTILANRTVSAEAFARTRKAEILSFSDSTVNYYYGYNTTVTTLSESVYLVRFHLNPHNSLPQRL